MEMEETNSDFVSKKLEMTKQNIARMSNPKEDDWVIVSKYHHA